MDNETKGRIFYEQEGLPLTEIGQRLGVPAATVRSWKYRNGWKKGTPIMQRAATHEMGSAKEDTQHHEATIEERMIASVEANESLNDKQRAFLLNYVSMFNATRAYQKAYGCSYNVANTEGPKLLVKPCIAEEIKRLKVIRNSDFWLDAEDILALHIRIAFADITDFLEFGRTEIQETGGVGSDGRTSTNKTENYMRLKDSDQVDGQLISSVNSSQGGVSLKLADKQKSLAFLERYFELCPMDTHKKFLDIAKLQLEERALTIKEFQHGFNDDENNRTGVVILPGILEDGS